jgi:predicted DsbA family dithiol-disulfide isomerase
VAPANNSHISQIIDATVSNVEVVYILVQIKVYFDYACPYCWIASQHVHRFNVMYPRIVFDWRPWEILPEAPPEGIKLEYDSVSPKLVKLASEVGLWMRVPSIQPNSHLALLGIFYAKEQGKIEEYHKAVFGALWEDDRNIGILDELSSIVEKTGLNSEDFKIHLVKHRERYESRLRESENDANNDSVELVPTYIFDGKSIVGNVSLRHIEGFVRRIARTSENL